MRVVVWVGFVPCVVGAAIQAGYANACVLVPKRFRPAGAGRVTPPRGTGLGTGPAEAVAVSVIALPQAATRLATRRVRVQRLFGQRARRRSGRDSRAWSDEGRSTNGSLC